jgi:hypothetical protein
MVTLMSRGRLRATGTQRDRRPSSPSSRLLGGVSYAAVLAYAEEYEHTGRIRNNAIRCRSLRGTHDVPSEAIALTRDRRTPESNFFTGYR